MLPNHHLSLGSNLAHPYPQFLHIFQQFSLYSPSSFRFLLPVLQLPFVLLYSCALPATFSSALLVTRCPVCHQPTPYLPFICPQKPLYFSFLTSLLSLIKGGPLSLPPNYGILITTAPSLCNHPLTQSLKPIPPGSKVSSLRACPLSIIG